MAGSGDRRPPLDEPVGIAISGDDASVWWEPACAGVARRYRIEGGCLLLADGPLESVMLYRLTSTPRRRSMRRTPLLAPLAMEDGYK